MQFFVNTKINITFAAMKVLRKILFNSFFLLAVFLCIGINSYSNYSLPQSNIELSTCNCNIVYSFSLDVDSLNEDQIDQSVNSGLLQEPFRQIPPHRGNKLICNFQFSVWQPPKIS